MQKDTSDRRRSPAATDWPTTLRFSRRMGDALRGPEYAKAFEGAEGPAPVRIHGCAPPRRGVLRRLALLLPRELRGTR